jgi:hypothetical protein
MPNIEEQLTKLAGNSNLFNEFACKLGFFKGPRVPKKAQFTQERVEYNVFLFDEPFKCRMCLR